MDHHALNSTRWRRGAELDVVPGRFGVGGRRRRRRRGRVGVPQPEPGPVTAPPSDPRRMVYGRNGRSVRLEGVRDLERASGAVGVLPCPGGGAAADSALRSACEADVTPLPVKHVASTRAAGGRVPPPAAPLVGGHGTATSPAGLRHAADGRPGVSADALAEAADRATRVVRRRFIGSWAVLAPLAIGAPAATGSPAAGRHAGKPSSISARAGTLAWCTPSGRKVETRPASAPPVP